MQIPYHKSAIFFIFLVLAMMAPSSALCDQRGKEQEPSQQLAKPAQQDAGHTVAPIDQQRQMLLEEISLLETSLAEEEAALSESKAKFDDLLQKERSLEAQFQQEEPDAERIMEVYLASRKDVEEALKSSLVHAQSPLLPATRDDSNGSQKAPSLADLEALADALFARMKSSGEAARYQGAFVSPQGTEVESEILRLGDFTAFYRRPEEVGFLKIDKTSGKLMGFAASSSWFDRSGARIKGYFAGKNEVVPVDLSSGEIFTQYDTGRTLLEWLQSGGILVWPILLVGLIAFLLIIERLIFLLRTRANSARLIARIQQLAADERWQECRESCSDHAKASVCRVLQAGLRNLGSSREVLEGALQEAIMKELPRLERFLSTISVLAAVAPLLGLLGTVSGMINTFQAITIHGTGDPRMLSGGISEALITTQLGLTVAVPVLILHHFLERRVGDIVREMEEKSTTLTVIMLKNRGIHAGMVSRAA
ncbi:MAG: MotA/TolQ/ExbB proton channel family protein [Desulforhabdus sp.]|nr:MotA/TolQ/ExbB proton channel family protein [Desulforhabdus sp.]